MFLPLPMDLLFEEKKIYGSEAWRNSRLGSTGTRRRGGLPYESMAVLTKADKWWTETKIQRLQSSMGIGTRTGIRGSKCSAQYLFWRGHRRRPPPPSSRPSPRPSVPSLPLFSLSRAEGCLWQGWWARCAAAIYRGGERCTWPAFHCTFILLMQGCPHETLRVLGRAQ